MPDINLLNAVYPDVPAVTLPLNGGGTAQFDYTADANATASDIASGKTAYVNGVKLTGTASGGGASNIVKGTFTTGSTRAGTGSTTISYTGSGYPISVMVYVDGGSYNNTSGGNTDWYNSVNRYDVGCYYMTKAQMNTTPTYATSGSQNYGCAAIIYKNSTSDATTYTRTSSMVAYVYNSGNASTSYNCIRFKGNGTTLSWYVGNLASNRVGLAPETKYAYIIVYSS